MTRQARVPSSAVGSVPRLWACPIRRRRAAPLSASNHRGGVPRSQAWHDRSAGLDPHGLQSGLPRSPSSVPPRLVVTWVGSSGVSRAFRRAHACLLQVGLLTRRLGALARHTPGPCGLPWVRPGLRPYGGMIGFASGRSARRLFLTPVRCRILARSSSGFGPATGPVTETAVVIGADGTACLRDLARSKARAPRLFSRHRRLTGRQCRRRDPAGPFGGTPSAVAHKSSHGPRPA